MRENAARKATRLLAEGRLAVIRVDDRGCLAMVRGDSAHIYTVHYYARRWTCTCEAVGPCSHAIAVARVVVVDGLTEPLPFPVETA